MLILTFRIRLDSSEWWMGPRQPEQNTCEFLCLDSGKSFHYLSKRRQTKVLWFMEI